MMNIFHISDLHFTSEPAGQLRDSTLASVRAILELAKSLRANGTLSSDAYVVATGDLVQTGGPNSTDDLCDFEAVQEALFKPLIEILKISPDKVFIVPGNHELDRAAVQEAQWLKQGQYVSQKICEADVNEDLNCKLKNISRSSKKRDINQLQETTRALLFLSTASSKSYVSMVW
jgi:predicted MPP superfamily phosphohydrolase